MTSLSTVGFGDYYPISDEERLVYSFVLLFGVMLFSIFMGQLIDMIYNFKLLDSDFNHDEELEKFFLMLRDQFNHRMPLDRYFQNEVSRFFHYSWVNNRNNFVISEEDLKIYSQLPRDCQLDIYRNFLFKEFLFKFRRFFSFRFSLLQR